jgi:transposase
LSSFKTRRPRQPFKAARKVRRGRKVFSNGRDFSVGLGLVLRQISTGDRTILGNVSKQGNRYLRVLFVQAAWVVVIKPQTRERYGLKQWISAAKRRRQRARHRAR